MYPIPSPTPVREAFVGTLVITTDMLWRLTNRRFIIIIMIRNTCVNDLTKSVNDNIAGPESNK